MPIQMESTMPTTRQSSFFHDAFSLTGIRAIGARAWNTLSSSGRQRRSLIQVNR